MVNKDDITASKVLIRQAEVLSVSGQFSVKLLQVPHAEHGSHQVIPHLYNYRSLHGLCDQTIALLLLRCGFFQYESVQINLIF